MYLRPLFTLAAALLLLTACSGDSSGTKTSQEDAPPVQTTDTTLVGKRLHLRFPDNISTVEYLSHKHLFWRSKDSVHGSKEGEDNYSAVRIGTSVFFVNWVEADGTTVSQVLDLDERTCKAFITSNVYSRNQASRSTSVLSGTIEKIEDANHLLLN
ncbi:MAG: MoaF N-terminal domain-containing protein [Porphyromonas sp.]|uniref:MoaF-related domain-containing protein n=1 Tax=Porphyromonas sp. TaxID=1924944 RepID=UPI001CB27C12|nr:MoaF N-terminal domain-containing protein [Porphyromonas sp.]MBF1311309.1 MoaF N-terminal domain-containing protein [Porphyromonadaceae bacterium]MBF1371286.1 MoaF N-terminal domain-containing protein [Porphyromonas sp.]